MSNIVPLNFIFSDETIKDGLVNISALASAYHRAYQKGSVGKKPTSSLCRDWLATKEAQDSIAYLERASGFPQSSLVIVEHGVGTWCSPDLAEIFAQWISVEYRFAVVRLIRETKEKSLFASKAVLEDIVVETPRLAPSLKQIDEAGGILGKLFGTLYQQRVVVQNIKKHYPALELGTPEYASLPSAKAFLTPTQIAAELGLKYKTGNPDPTKVNKLLEKLGYQAKIQGSWSASEKAIASNLCDRKPIDTNSRTQRDQLLWSEDIVLILKEHCVRN